MLARYQRWALEADRFSAAELESLSSRLQTRGQVGNVLTAEEQGKLNSFLRSDTGRTFVGELDSEQVARKWQRVGEPLSQVQWLRELSRTDPGEAAEIVAMTSKLYNQNEVRGGRLIERLQDNVQTSAQTSEWIGTEGIDGLRPLARSAIVSGRDNALVGIRLMNALETGEGQLSRMWRQEVHDRGNIGLTTGFNTNPTVQLLDKVMRDPINGERLRAQLTAEVPSRQIIMSGGVAETARIELTAAGELSVRSPGGVTSLLTPQGWIERQVQDPVLSGQHADIPVDAGNAGRNRPQGQRMQVPENPADPTDREQSPERPECDPPAQDLRSDSRDDPLYEAIRRELHAGISDEKMAFIVLQAKHNGIHDVGKLDEVIVHEGNVWIAGKTPGEFAKVGLSDPAPPLQETQRQSEAFDVQRGQQLAQGQQEDQQLNQAAQAQGVRTRTLV